MTDDYTLFPDAAVGEPPLDPDVALISAYLAHELSRVQIAAVELRLATDPEFKAAVAPIMDAWNAPIGDALIGDSSPVTPLFASRAELDARWQSHVGARRDVHQTKRTASRRSTMRAAAVIALVTLPLLAVAQAVRYVAHRPGSTLLEKLGFGGSVRSDATPLVLAPGRGASHPVGLDSSAAGATLVAAQQAVPVRPLGRTVAVSPVPFINPLTVRQLSNGRVWVNDPGARLVLALDSTLANPTIVIDSAQGRSNSYGPLRVSITLPYLGDTTIFIDGMMASMMFLDPSGRIGRVIPAPYQEVAYLTNPAYGYPAVDARGRLVYRVHTGALQATDSAVVVAMDLAPAGGRVGGGGSTGPPLDRNLAKLRRVDTIGAVKIEVFAPPAVPTPGYTLARYFASPDAALAPAGIRPPLIQAIDAWAVTSSGVIAFVRGQDYHVDWVRADGTRSTSPALPYSRLRLSDAAKVRQADSATAAHDSGLRARVDRMHPGPEVTYDALGGVIGIRDANQPGAVPAALKTTPVSPRDVPDYLPPFGHDAVRADADGQLWIHTTSTGPMVGGPIYDVVNGSGALVDRVQLPAGRTLLGFGAGGIVYLVSRDAGVPHVEKARFR